MNRFAKWWVESAWPWISDTAVPAVAGAYAAHEAIRHLVTFLVGLFIGWVFL